MLGCLKSAVHDGLSAMHKECENREHASAEKLAETTFNDYVAQVEGDAARLEVYLEQRARWTNDAAKLEARYMCDLRNMGAAAARTSVDKATMFCPHFTKGGKPTHSEYTDPALRPGKYIATVEHFVDSQADNTVYIHVLDYLVFTRVDLTQFQGLYWCSMHYGFAWGKTCRSAYHNGIPPHDVCGLRWSPRNQT